LRFRIKEREADRASLTMCNRPLDDHRTDPSLDHQNFFCDDGKFVRFIQLQPLVPPQVSHLKQVPFLTMV
jgi:hypothetical protein